MTINIRPFMKAYLGIIFRHFSLATNDSRRKDGLFLIIILFTYAEINIRILSRYFELKKDQN